MIGSIMKHASNAPGTAATSYVLPARPINLAEHPRSQGKHSMKLMNVASRT
jgi:hypothetical protein